MYKCLYVGGPYDGKREFVRALSPRRYVPELREHASVLATPDGAVANVTTHTYRLEIAQSESSVCPSLYAHESIMNEAALLAVLIQGYKT